MAENENILFEVGEQPETEESDVSSEEETLPEPDIAQQTEPEPEPEPSKVKRTKTGRVRKKASPRTAERLRAQLAKGRAKSLEIRRRNKKLKELDKRKKIDEEDMKLLEELQDRKTNSELQNEIKLLKEQLKKDKVPEKDLELPKKPAPQKTGPKQIIETPTPKIKSMLPNGFSLKQLRGL